MKLRLDIPNQFAVQRYVDHENVRDMYLNIMQSAIRLGLDFSASRARNATGECRAESDEEIRYAFHSENVGEDVYCLKSSAITRYWFFDNCGYSGWSQIAQDEALQKEARSFNLERARAFIHGYREDIAKNNLSKLKQSDAPLEDDIARLGDFIFYPMQVDNDRVLAHLPWAQSEVLRRLIDLAKIHDRPVVIKRHPLCASDAISSWLETAAEAPNVYLTQSSIHHLIPRSSCVLVANSGVGIEALMHGKPVYAMAQSEYRHIANPVSDLNELEALFTHPPTPQSEMTERLLGHLFLEYLVDSCDDGAIEARMRRHIRRHARAAAFEADQKRKRIEIKQSVLNERVKEELSSRVELLLMPGAPALEQTQDKRIDFLSRAAILGVKRKLIRLKAGPDTCIQAAEAFLKEKNWVEAKNFAEVAIGAPHTEGRARFVIAQIAFHDKNEQSAIPELRRCLPFDDVAVRARILLAHCLLQTAPESHEEIEELIQQALAIDPTRFNAHLLLARLAQTRDNREELLKHLETARALAPDHPAVLRASVKFGFDAAGPAD